MARHLLLCGALVLCLCCSNAAAEISTSFAASPELSKALAEHNSTLEDSWATVLAATLLANSNGGLAFFVEKGQSSDLPIQSSRDRKNVRDLGLQT